MNQDSETTETRVDQLDRRIIAALQSEGRRPFADIALELRVSEGTVRQRYRKLVDADILQIVGVADPFRIGYSTMAMVGVNIAIDGDHGVDKVARTLCAFPEVSYVVMSTGSFDLLVEIITQSHQEFARFLTEDLHRVDGVRRTETFMLLRVYKMALGGWRVAQTSDASVLTDKVE